MCIEWSIWRKKNIGKLKFDLSSVPLTSWCLLSHGAGGCTPAKFPFSGTRPRHFLGARDWTMHTQPFNSLAVFSVLVLAKNCWQPKSYHRVTTSCRACLMILDKRGSGFPVIFLPLLALCSLCHWTVVHLRRHKARPLSFSHLYFCARPNVPSVTCEQSLRVWRAAARSRDAGLLGELFLS